MLGDIKADQLFLRLYPQFCEYADNTDADERTHDCDCDGDQDADDLSGKKSGLAEYKAVPARYGVDGALSEESGGNAAPYAADPVASERIQRIVDLQLMLHELHCKIADRADQRADDKRGPDRDETSSRRDGDEADDQARAGAHKRRLAVFDRVDQHPGEKCGRCGDGGCHECVRCQAIRCESAAGVEPIPSEPQKRCAQGHEGNIVDAVGSLLVSLSPAEINGEYKCAHSGADMYHVAPCKVYRADRCEESAFAPDHVCHRVIDDDRPECDKCEQRFEFHPADHCACDECRSDHGEHHLECREYKMRDRVRVRPCLPAYAV